MAPSPKNPSIKRSLADHQHEGVKWGEIEWKVLSHVELALIVLIKEGNVEEPKIQQFRKILLALLNSHCKPFRRDEITIDRSSDEFDQVRDAIEREVAIRRLEVDAVRTREIEAALHRIEEGTYGECLRCDAEISIKRLQAVPWAPYCLLCQDLADQEKQEAASQRSEAIVCISDRADRAEQI